MHTTAGSAIYTSTTNGQPTLPIHHRHTPIRYQGGSATIEAYPINHDELYNLKGRLLTLIDATFPDLEQRKAQKDMVWQTLRSWLNDIAHAK